jgi:Phage capsid family
MAFTDFINRTGAAGELPDQIATELIEAVIRDSVVLTMAHRVPTTTRDSRIPVVDTLPAASWVGPSGTDSADVGLKSVTAMTIGNKQLIAEELACIAVIPENVIADSEYDIWAAVKPELAAAIARAYDAAVLFGVNKPTTFPNDLVAAATAAGTVVSGDVWLAATDVPALVLNAASLVSAQGYNVNAVAVSPGWEFRTAAHRTNVLQNNPVGANTPFPLLLAGMNVRTRPLYWPAPVTNGPDAIVADWSLVLAGIRKDITLEPFREGVITDATGVVKQNLMQEDKVAVRATFRAGYYLATPPTGYTVATPCPVGVVKNSGTVFTPHLAEAEASAAPRSGKHA